MKIAVGSMGYNLDSSISDIFGRSSAFIIVNLEEEKIKDMSVIENPQKLCFRGVKNYEIFNNPAKNGSGAGSIAAQIMADHEVKAIISGKLGPVAFHILKNAGIKVYKITPGSVEKNLKRFMESKLEEITTLSGGFPL